MNRTNATARPMAGATGDLPDAARASPGSAANPPKNPFKLVSRRTKESALQAQICQWLRAEQARGRVVWFCRVNGGLAQYGQQRIRNYVLHLRGVAPVGKGYADLHGMLAGGRYFALEVKRPGEEATPEQARFLATVCAGGGIAAVVRGFEDAARALTV